MYYVDVNMDITDANVDTLEDFCTENGYHIEIGSCTVPSEEGGVIALPKFTLVKDPKYLDVAKIFRKYTELKTENRKLKLKIKELEQIASIYYSLYNHLQHINNLKK